MENQNPTPPPSQPTPPAPATPAPSHHRMRGIILGLLGILLLAAFGFGGYVLGQQNNNAPITPSPTSGGCREDVRICEDGTKVGRIPPKCEFAACPNIEPSPSLSWREKVSIDLPENWVVINNSILDKEINGKVMARVWPDSNECLREHQGVIVISTETKTIKGLPFTVILGRDDGGEEAPYPLGALYCISQNNNEFSIKFYEYGNSNDKLTAAPAKLFDQIAGSIKFISSEPTN